MAAHQQVGSFEVVNTFGVLRKNGGNVASYFCTPDGRVVHALAGPVPAIELLDAAHWAVETFQQTGGDPARIGEAHRDAARAPDLRGTARSQAKIHELLSDPPLPSLGDVYRPIFEDILGQRISKPDNDITRAETAFAAARRAKLPLLLILHKGKDNAGVLQEWNQIMADRGRTGGNLLALLGRSYVVVALPLKELAALSGRMHIPPYAAPDNDSPLFVIARSNGHQLDAVTTWNKPDALAYALALGLVQEAKEHDRSPVQLQTLLEQIGRSTRASPATCSGSRPRQRPAGRPLRSPPRGDLDPMRPHILPLALALVLAMSPCGFADPEIFSLDPETGPAGTVITLKGKGLELTEHVVFAVGRTVKPARFKVVSDRELEIIAPEYYRPHAAATVAVFTRAGATVAMPATAQTIRDSTRAAISRDLGASFYHVLDGGIVNDATSVSLIESGGIVEHGTRTGMHFVRRGGMLLDFENPNGIVFHEPGAIFGPEIGRSRLRLTFIKVSSVSVSPGVGPFTYERIFPPDPGDAPAAPPQIRSIEPHSASAGDIIILHGHGFGRTTSVLAVEGVNRPRPAGFRVVSDDVLKVEVPDESSSLGPQLLVVLGSEGVTITVPRDRMVRAALNNGVTPDHHPFYWLDSGDIAGLDGGVPVFVKKGGLLTRSGSSLVFVEHGGRIADGAGGPPIGLYYEPGAVVPQSLKTGRNAREVPQIVLSFLPHALVIIPGPVFRR